VDRVAQGGLAIRRLLFLHHRLEVRVDLLVQVFHLFRAVLVVLGVRVGLVVRVVLVERHSILYQDLLAGLCRLVHRVDLMVQEVLGVLADQGFRPFQEDQHRLADLEGLWDLGVLAVRVVRVDIFGMAVLAVEQAIGFHHVQVVLDFQDDPGHLVDRLYQEDLVVRAVLADIGNNC